MRKFVFVGVGGLEGFCPIYCFLRLRRNGDEGWLKTIFTDFVIKKKSKNNKKKYKTKRKK